MHKHEIIMEYNMLMIHYWTRAHHSQYNLIWQNLVLIILNTIWFDKTLPKSTHIHMWEKVVEDLALVDLLRQQILQPFTNNFQRLGVPKFKRKIWQSNLKWKIVRASTLALKLGGNCCMKDIYNSHKP